MFIKRFALISTLLIMGGEILASLFTWYDTLPLYDVYMHFLGGIWVTSSILLVIHLHPQFSFFTASKIKNIIIMVSVVMCIGILWEFYEYIVYTLTNTTPLYDMYTDTILDLVMDFSGTLITSFLLIKEMGKK